MLQVRSAGIAMCIAMTSITGATLVAIGVYAMYASWNVINVII